MRNAAKVFLFSALGAVLAAGGVGAYLAFEMYQCDHKEERLRNIIFRGVQQSRLEGNLDRLEIDWDQEDFGDMRARRDNEMRELMTEMVDRCGSDSVDTALRRAASEDYGL